MTRRAAALAAALLVAAACSRTKHVRSGDEKEGKAEATQGRVSGRGSGIPSAPGRPPVPAAPQGLLEPGMIQKLQGALSSRGLLKEHRGGELDAPTTAAIRKFQEQRRLAATGFPDRETLKDLGIDPERAYVREEDRKRQEGEGDAGAAVERGRAPERGERAPERGGTAGGR